MQSIETQLKINRRTEDPVMHSSLLCDVGHVALVVNDWT